jgi:hypothetical protein
LEIFCRELLAAAGTASTIATGARRVAGPSTGIYAKQLATLSVIAAVVWCEDGSRHMRPETVARHLNTVEPNGSDEAYVALTLSIWMSGPAGLMQDLCRKNPLTARSCIVDRRALSM